MTEELLGGVNLYKIIHSVRNLIELQNNQGIFSIDFNKIEGNPASLPISFFLNSLLPFGLDQV